MEYMAKAKVSSFRVLAKETGIEYRTLLNHIDEVENLRVFEIEALDQVLKFTDEDLLKLVRGRT